MKAEAVKKIGRYFGVAIIVVACVFVADRIVSTRAWMLVDSGRDGLVSAVAVGAGVYALSAFLLSGAWVVLLRACGESRARIRVCVSVYGRSQLAKYIPGNVFHFVGRHVMGRHHSFDHGAMVWAAFLEAVGLVVVAGAVALPGAIFWFEPAIPGSSLAIIVVSGGLLLVAPYVLPRVLPRLATARGLAVHVLNVRVIYAKIMPAYMLYLAFFVVSGCIAWGIAVCLDETVLSALPVLVVAIATAWIAGFVTPGAAAGIGVREAVLIATLSGTLGEANAAVVALAFRVVTLGGDLVFFALSFALASDMNRSEA